MDLSFRQENEQVQLKSSLRENFGEASIFARMTRPDISCSVRDFGLQVTPPSISHGRGLQHVLRYIDGTLDFGINYKKSTDKGINTLIRCLDSG